MDDHSVTTESTTTLHREEPVIYDFYKNTFGRDSYDGNGAAPVSSVRYQTGYQNAYWSGSQMVYGDGMAGLDGRATS